MIQKSIFDYEVRVKPEFISKMANMSKIADGENTGYIARETGQRGNLCYLPMRRRAKRNHFSAKEDGFPIHTETLSVLGSRGVEIVFVINKDKMEMFEFTLNDYLQGTEIDHSPFENHRCVPVSLARHVWDVNEVIK